MILLLAIAYSLAGQLLYRALTVYYTPDFKWQSQIQHSVLAFIITALISLFAYMFNLDLIIDRMAYNYNWAIKPGMVQHLGMFALGFTWDWIFIKFGTQIINKISSLFSTKKI